MIDRPHPMDVLLALPTAEGVSLAQRLDPWQREDFDAALLTDRHQWWERPRGHSKTEDSGLVALVQVLVGPPGQRIFFAATDQDQAALAFDTLRGFVRRSPALQGRLRVLRREVVHEAMDSTVAVLASDADSSWGLRPSRLFCDELSRWRTDAHKEFFWSLWSSLGKVHDARIVVATTAHWDRTGLCWQLREKVEHDPAWHFSVRGQCASWISPEFLEEQRRLLPAHLYEMLHENRWTTVGAEFLTWDEIEAVFDPNHVEQRGPVPSGRYWFGLDLATAKDRTALAVVRADGDTAVIDSLALWAGTPRERVQLADVEATVLAAARRFAPIEVVVDPFQGLLLAERLRRAGLNVHEFPFSAQSRTVLFDTLLQLIRQRRLRSFPHQGLREELAGLRWVEKAGVLRPDHPATGHDDAVVAVGLAATQAVAQAIAPRPSAGRVPPGPVAGVTLGPGWGKWARW
jgi:phage terminase large subunit-like protein